MKLATWLLLFVPFSASSRDIYESYYDAFRRRSAQLFPVEEYLGSPSIENSFPADRQDEAHIPIPDYKDAEDVDRVYKSARYEPKKRRILPTKRPTPKKRKSTLALKGTRTRRRKYNR